MDQVQPKLPLVTLGSTDRNAADADLSDVIESWQSCLLSSCSEQNPFTCVESFFCALC